MGLSHAAAAAVIFLAATITGFQITGEAFDRQDELAEAWSEFHASNQAQTLTAFTIDDVRKIGASRTEVTLTNTGQTTIDASGMILLYNGAPQAITSWTVNGVVSDVWAPASELVLTTAALSPTDVVAIDSTGVKAYWRI